MRSISTSSPSAFLVALLASLLQPAWANNDNQVQAYANANGNYRDDTYYAQGVANPNAVADSMYWKDGRHVLADLDQFEALYVQYQNCAYEPSWGEEGDHHGGGGDETWYLSSTPPEVANVAFSLYGVPTGSSTNDKHPCNKRTFINSFHTTLGVESFTNALYAAGLGDLFPYQDGEDDDGNQVSFTSACNGADDRRQRREKENDNVQNGQAFDSYETSTGVGCNAENPTQFAMQTYHGGYCQVGTGVVSIDDTLDDMNSKLEQNAPCVKLYTKGDYYNGNGGDNKNEDNSATPLAVLQSSHACYVEDADCPDPYGKLRQYANQLRVATGAGAPTTWWTPENALRVSNAFFTVGSLLTLMALGLLVKEWCCPRSATADGSKVGQKKNIMGGAMVALSKSVSRSFGSSKKSHTTSSTRNAEKVDNNSGIISRTSSKHSNSEKADPPTEIKTDVKASDSPMETATGVIDFILSKSQEFFADEYDGKDDNNKNNNNSNGDDEANVANNNQRNEQAADTDASNFPNPLIPKGQDPEVSDRKKISKKSSRRWTRKLLSGRKFVEP